MTENDLIKRIAIAKAKPDNLNDLRPSELADLVLIVLEYVKRIQKDISEGKIKGEKGDDAPELVPDVDYLSLSTAKEELDYTVSLALQEMRSDVKNALSKVRNGKDGRDAQVTDKHINEAAKIASQLIQIPDFATLITQEPETIRNSLELLQGDERLSVKAISGIDELIAQLEKKITSNSGGGGAGARTIKWLNDITNASTAASGTVLKKNADGTFSFLVESAVEAQIASIEFVIDGGGSAITTGIKGDLEIPFNCIIQSWTLLADQSGSIVIDVWKDTLANFPPIAGDSITGSSIPTLSSQSSATSSTLTGWTTTINAGDILRYNVDSITDITRVTLSLKVIKT